jgi:trans-aconitate methyltransferase
MLRNRAPQHQHKGFAPVCVDVGCSVSQPADMLLRRYCHVTIQAIDK